MANGETRLAQAKMGKPAKGKALKDQIAKAFKATKKPKDKK